MQIIIGHPMLYQMVLLPLLVQIIIVLAQKILLILGHAHALMEHPTAIMDPVVDLKTIQQQEVAHVLLEHQTVTTDLAQVQKTIQLPEAALVLLNMEPVHKQQHMEPVHKVQHMELVHGFKHMEHAL
jgi:hypothetical protein